MSMLSIPEGYYNFPSIEPEWTFINLPVMYLPARQQNKNNNQYSFISTLFLVGLDWRDIAGFKMWLHKIYEEDFVLKNNIPKVEWK